MEVELILTELQPFKLSHVWQLFCLIGYNQLYPIVLEGFFSYFVNMLEHNEDLHMTF